MWRCVNNIYGYCTDEPEWEIAPKEIATGGVGYGKCKLDPKSCGKYQDHVERCQEELLKAKALGIPWALEPEKELEEQPAEQVVTKKKAKVAKKPKVKIQQVGMFE